MSEDILDRLRSRLNCGSDEDVEADWIAAIAEIEYLRSLAGAVMRGESHADIKARTGHKESDA